MMNAENVSDNAATSTTTTTTTTWDDICIDPHEEFLQQGRHEGRDAGLAAGFNDGQALGRTTGLEYGMELGFIRGVLQALTTKNQIMSSSSIDEQNDDASLSSTRIGLDDKSINSTAPPAATATKHRNRIKTTMKNLAKALDEFPNEDLILQQKQDNHHPSTRIDSSAAAIENKRDFSVDNDDTEHETTSSNNIHDVRHAMQRVRARFKLLTVQLGIPHFSLAQVMNEASLAACAPPAATTATTTTTDTRNSTSPSHKGPPPIASSEW